MFISIGWFLHDPVSLFSSSVLALSSFVFLISMKKLRITFKVQHFIIWLIPFGYSISALVNKQNYETFFMGAYARNFGTLTWISLGLIFLYIFSNTKLDVEKYIKNGLMSLVLVATSYGLIQSLGLDPLPWLEKSKRVTLTLGNANFAGALIGMLAFVPLVIGFQAKSIIKKFLLLSLGALCALMGIQTNTFQSIAMLILSTLIFISFYFMNSPDRLHRIIRNGIFLTIGSSLLVLINATFGIIKVLSPINSQIYSLGNIEARLAYWRTGFEIWKDHPVFGVGVGEMQRFAAMYRTPNQLKFDSANVLQDRAHNVFIDHFAEGGLISGIGWILFVITISYFAFEVANKSTNLNEKVQYGIFSTIWFLYLFQAVISPDHILLTLLAIISAAFLSKKHIDYQKNENNSSIKTYELKDVFVLRAVLIFLLVLVLVLVSKAMSVDNKVKNILDGNISDSVQIQNTIKTWNSPVTTEDIAISEFTFRGECNSIRKYTEIMLQQNPRSTAAWYLNANCSNKELNFKQAIKETEMALVYDPKNSIFISAVAKLQIADGDLEGAKKTLEKLIQLNPNDPEVESIRNSLPD
jgi:O-antigen ligase